MAAVFPAARPAEGMYESFYLRCVSPLEPVGVWIRYTVHKRPGAEAKGSVWFTLFDARAGGRGGAWAPGVAGGEGPLQRKLTTSALSVPAGAWIGVGHSVLSGQRAEGAIEEVSWSLEIERQAPELRHLSPEWLYGARLPRTKLTSPAPLARISGSVRVAGGEPLSIEGWPGMVGHNWGAEHAERWIWLSGMGFEGEDGAALDLALGRVRVGRALTPWAGSGALWLGGRRYRLGGLPARGTSVMESVEGCRFRVRGEGGITVEGLAVAPLGSRAGWRYADPDGGEHEVMNCSVARLEVDVRELGARLETGHCGAYELGMRERGHGVAIAPYGDG